MWAAGANERRQRGQSWEQETGAGGVGGLLWVSDAATGWGWGWSAVLTPLTPSCRVELQAG